MSARPRLLDLFCGAGGASFGYSQAGFDVVGVDHLPQKNYPFEFQEGDALTVIMGIGGGGFLKQFSAIHCSPPCQGYSRLRHLPWLKAKKWPLLIDACRDLLDATGLPWVMENVEDAPLRGITLCGRMFDLPVYRHRRFESSVMLMQPPHHPHQHVIGSGPMLNDRRKRDPAFKGTLNAGSKKGSWGTSPIVTVAGGQFKKSEGEAALGIDWMSKAELCQAIPPAYTEFIGRQLLAVLENRRQEAD